jgi:hypothetical protein
MPTAGRALRGAGAGAEPGMVCPAPSRRRFTDGCGVAIAAEDEGGRAH